ncbi:unnamed protein product [Ixodes hexagonus]
MGVPKFYRWISERYPCLSTVVKEYQIPEFDNLYLDMNGIIHVCSHPNDDDPHFRISEERIFLDIFNYIDFLFRMIKPRKTFFMAVDGVAPRAKMNQQRGRRFRSAKEALALEKQALSRGEVLPTEARFDSNCISPGTSFMANLQEQLEQFVAVKISSDPLWQGVNVYLSGHQTPGEGEHKIMDFIRTERSKPGYDPNTRHCLYGLDADLIMLGSCSHEPHFALLREEIVYGKKQNQKRLNVPEEITFHLLHLSLLREYLSYEFQAVKESLPFEFSLESIVDDWVLMCFLVGNDFLPHLPNLHIAHNALPTLYQAYIEVLPTLGGYINEQGTLNLERFEKFLKRLSQFDYEKFTDVQADQKFLESKRVAATTPNGVVNQDDQDKAARDKERDPDEQRLLEKFAHLDIPDYESDDESEGTLEMEFRQHKRDYYTTKLEYKDVNKEVMQEQAHGYVRAIQWNLHYYYNGVQSWDWYYPHHYSPYISDIKDFQSIDMSFELGKPFLPFQQLMSILPAASKGLVPKAYQALMESEESPVLDYYPKDFITDLNGKQQEWEAVVLIPFIDEDRLLPVMQELDSKLTDEERDRNTHGGHLLFTYSREPVAGLRLKKKGLLPDIEANHARVEVLDQSIFRLPKEEIKKGLLDGVKMDVYFAGFPTFRHLAHSANLARACVKVFQSISKNESMVLTLTETRDKTLKEVADDLLGKSVYVNWPHLLEALVVAVYTRDERFTLHEPAKGGVVHTQQTHSEVEVFDMQMISISERYRTRYGVNLGDIEIVVLCRTITGRKYICGSKGRITLEKQWSVHPVPFAVQSLVRDITEHCPEFEQFKTIEEVFPVGTTCFMIGHPHYGCQGEVVDPKPSNKQGRIVVKLNIPSEPNLEGVVRNEKACIYRAFHARNLSQVYYMSSHQLAQWLGVNGLFVSRITGTVYVQMNSREADAPSLVNVGLNLKFNKSGEEVPGYSKRANETWFYSNKCHNVLQEYLTKRCIPIRESGPPQCDTCPRVRSTGSCIHDPRYRCRDTCSYVRIICSCVRESGPPECLTGSRVRATGSRIRDTGFRVRDTRSHVRDTGSRLRDTGSRVRDSCSCVHDTCSRVRDTGPRVRDTGPRVCESGPPESDTGPCVREFGPPEFDTCPRVCDTGSRIRDTCSRVRDTCSHVRDTCSRVHDTGSRVRDTGPVSANPVPLNRIPVPVSANSLLQKPFLHFHHCYREQSSCFLTGKNLRKNLSENTRHRWHRLLPPPFSWLSNALPQQRQQSRSKRLPVLILFFAQCDATSVCVCFMGAEKMQQNITESPPVSSIGALAELIQRTKESMGSEPVHYVVCIDDTEPFQKYKAFVILPDGKKYASACTRDKKSALQDAAKQALPFVPTAGSLQARSVAPTSARQKQKALGNARGDARENGGARRGEDGVRVPAKRPSVPMPFGNAPPASALPGLRMRLPPPCDAALIPDSFVETNQLLLESLSKLGPPSAEELASQVSWQTPRMAPPFPMPAGMPGQAPPLATTEQQQHQPRMPFYHVPTPQALYLQQRPTFFMQQQQQHYRPSPPQFDTKLRFHTRPPLLKNEVPGQMMMRHQQPLHQQPVHQQLHQQLHQRQQQQQKPQPHHQVSTQRVARNGEAAESNPPCGKQPSTAAGYAFVPTQVLRNKAPPLQKPSTAGKMSKNEKKSGGAAAAAAMPPKTASTSTNRKPTNKQSSQQQDPKADKTDTASQGSEEKGKEKINSASPTKDVPPPDSKPKQRRSRLAVKFDNDPNAT